MSIEKIIFSKLVHPLLFLKQNFSVYVFLIQKIGNFTTKIFFYLNGLTSVPRFCVLAQKIWGENSKSKKFEKVFAKIIGKKVGKK